MDKVVSSTSSLSLLVSLLVSGLAGCGSSGGNPDAGLPDAGLPVDSGISSQPLSGRVGGQPWSLGTAETNPALSMTGDTIWAEMYPEMFDPCMGGGFPSTHYLLMSIPKTIGDYPISTTLIQTFVVEQPATTDNFGATSGRMVVREITATVIRGEARIEFDADNTVEGRFEATVCPPQ
jgi:hypothetical protein